MEITSEEIHAIKTRLKEDEDNLASKLEMILLQNLYFALTGKELEIK